MQAQDDAVDAATLQDHASIARQSLLSKWVTQQSACSNQLRDARATTSPAYRWLTQHTRKFTPGRTHLRAQLCVTRKFLIRQADRSANGGERCLSAFRFGPAKIQSGTSIGTKSRKKFIMKYSLWISFQYLSPFSVGPFIHPCSTFQNREPVIIVQYTNWTSLHALLYL